MASPETENCLESELTDPYDGFLHRTRAEAENIAKSRGLIVRAPKPNELFVDIDSLADLLTLNEQLEAFPKGFVLSETMTHSPSGAPGKFHVVVTIARPVHDELERVLLQALLGSDLMRELLSWRRIEDGSDPDAISLFFEKPDWNVQVAIPTTVEVMDDGFPRE